MNQATNSAAEFSDPPLFRREVFAYAIEGRRDPFLPPGTIIVDNPMVGGFRLLGIIHHPQADLSVALLESGMQSEEGNDGAAAGMHLPGGVRLRVGATMGDARIAEIHADHVVAEIALPGGVARRIMEMPRSRSGRGS